MSAVGIDFSNENCYVAVARAGGIEIVTNEYSQRATPAYVAFGPTCRDLGTSAKNKFITNLKNTVCSFKRLIGFKYRDSALQNQISYLPNPVCELQNGGVGFMVEYLGNNARFTTNQIAAMLITKLKHITEAAYQSKVTDCVISVPPFFNDAERRAMLDICRIANVNVLRLLNDTAAVSLAYGFYRQDLTESKAKRVIFIDIGHSAVQASLVEFYKGKLQVLFTVCDPCVGGRDFDNAMVRYFSEEFKKKYNLNVLSNRRAIVRLLQECEKLKKQLSANPQSLPLNIECLMDDMDVSSSMGREKFEELCADLFLRIEAVFQRLLAETHMYAKDISAVEIVGGSTRVPAVKNIIKKVFGIEPSTSLNLDEAVARGCALQAAMLTPTVKVKEMQITDAQFITIKLNWDISKEGEGNVEAFSRNHPIPYSKLLTFFRKEDITLNAFYALGEEPTPIGSFTVRVNQSAINESAKIIVKIRVNIHGIFTVVSAFIVDKDSKENMVVDQKSEDATDVKLRNFNVSNEAAAVEEKKNNFFSLKKHKKTTQDIELEVESKVPELSEEEIRSFIEVEKCMINQDIGEEKRINAKNSLEEFVYEMRNKLTDELKDHITTQELNSFLEKLNEIENWLYEEGEDQNESVYLGKLENLKCMVDPVSKRKHNHEMRALVISEFDTIINQAQQIISAYLISDEQYSHIESEEMEKVQKAVHEKHNWLQQQLKTLEAIKMHEDSPISSEEIFSKKEELKKEIYPILSKPKPQVEHPTENSTDPNASCESKA